MFSSISLYTLSPKHCIGDNLLIPFAEDASIFFHWFIHYLRNLQGHTGPTVCGVPMRLSMHGAKPGDHTDTYPKSG